ncbi:MAG: metal-dependent transcriptional regulator [Clostridiales bacterium]|nr:metal-dependent transcriptional regulator [Clostridia bacterium]MCR4563486.1 metal-dependent transcriptional regulator [Clostridiales bacterium]
MHLQESGEMYLETILVLSKKQPYVRSLDVAEYMGFSKPSVSRAVGLLRNGGYLDTDEDGHLILTDLGKEIAEKIYERHQVLTDVLVKLGVNKETATDDACKIEHDISDETFKAIKKWVKKNK